MAKLEPVTNYKENKAGNLKKKLQEKEYQLIKLQYELDLVNEASDNMGDGLVVYDNEDRLIYWNKRALEIYSETKDLFIKGITIEDMLYKAVERGQYGEIDDIEFWIAQRLYQYCQPQGIFTEKLSNNTWVQVKDRKLEDGRTIGTRTDITELKKREEALIESEERFRSVAQSAEDAILAADSDGTIISWNPAAEIIFGYDIAEALGISITKLFPENEQNHFIELIGQSFDSMLTPDEGATEICAMRKNGSIFPIEINVASWESINGKFVSLIIRDITKRKEDEAKQAQLENRLRQAQKMEALGTLAGGTAHEFNNMLVPMLGLTELVMDDLEKESIAYTNLEKVLEAGQRAKVIVKQILSFCRDQQRELGKMDLTKELGDALDLLRSTLPSTIKITTDITPDPLIIWADKTEIHQIIVNLASNSAHAMKGKPGNLKFTLLLKEITAEKAQEIGNISPGKYAFLCVSDDGCGMDEQTRQRIFEPFFTTKDVGEGTGLGLAMIHAIITRAEGHIEVESEIGKGTNFKIMIPIFNAKN